MLHAQQVEEAIIGRPTDAGGYGRFRSVFSTAGKTYVLALMLLMLYFEESTGSSPDPAARRVTTRGQTEMVHTQLTARQFFQDKVTEQADIEGVTLSADERQMLRWSESEPDSVADPALVKRLASEISDADYEEKIAGLLRRRFGAEVAADAGAKALWRQAWTVLNQGDHYILILIDQAVRKQMRPWWKFSG